MKRFLQNLLRRPVQWLADKYSSKPNKERVHTSLNKLYQEIKEKNEKKGLLIQLDTTKDKYIIFSDQHKGVKDGADDFAFAEKNYLAALEYYFKEGYSLISLGDEEELWENSILNVPRKNKDSYELEKKYFEADRYYKVFGNHDIYWNNDPFASLQLIRIFGKSFKVYEALILQTTEFNIFLTHGHQGDGQSDGNKFSAWFISNVWAPLQNFLKMNTNTPSANDHLKTLHNQFMYEWSSQQENTLLITGHTHQPVFASLTHLETLFKQLLAAKRNNDEAKQKELEKEIAFRRQEHSHVASDYLSVQPTYFNSGCCCFSDGDISGIEIAEGQIRLIKWEYDEKNIPQRKISDEDSLLNIINAMKK